jgi:predicted Fe-Mo cluster-binding NifX family protein
MDFQMVGIYANEKSGLSGGSGIQTVGFVSSKGVSFVLIGNCGPKAMHTLTAAGLTFLSTS